MPQTMRLPGLGLALAGTLILAGGNLHPRADTSFDIVAAQAVMLADPGWPSAHLVALAGVLVLAATLAMCLRRSWFMEHGNLRTLLMATLVAASVSAVELIPHTLASSELEALRAGDDTPLNDVHLLLQAFATPMLGLSIAGLAVLGARTRALGHWGAVPFAVVGGVAFSLAGPGVVLLEDPRVSVLFIGGAGVAVWLIVAGIRLAWSPQASPGA